jgi:hypothetical protein
MAQLCSINENRRPSQKIDRRLSEPSRLPESALPLLSLSYSRSCSWNIDPGCQANVAMKNSFRTGQIFAIFCVSLPNLTNLRAFCEAVGRLVTWPAAANDKAREQIWRSSANRICLPGPTIIWSVQGTTQAHFRDQACTE